MSDDPLLTRLRFLLTPYKVRIKLLPLSDYSIIGPPGDWFEFTRCDGRKFSATREAIENGCSVLQLLNDGREVPDNAHFCTSCGGWIDAVTWQAEHYIHCLRAQHNRIRRY